MLAMRISEQRVEQTSFSGGVSRHGAKGPDLCGVSLGHPKVWGRFIAAILCGLLPILPVVCSNSKQDVQAAKEVAPPCIGLVQSAAVITEMEGPRATKWETRPVLIPLGVYVSGRWLSPSNYDEGEANLKVPMTETSFWESLSVGVFHAVGVPESKFTPSRKVQYEGWGGGSLAGLACTVEGPDKLAQLFAPKEEGDAAAAFSERVVVVNRPGIPGDVDLSTAGLPKEEIQEIAYDGLSEAYQRFLDVLASTWANRPTSDSFGIPRNSRLEIEEVHRFRITQEQEGVWLSVTAKWPKGIRVGDTVRKDWEGGYYGILRVNSGEKYEPLWASAYIDQPEYPQSNARFYHFVGCGDGDGDGVNEVVMTESYIEDMEYQVYALVNWSAYVKVASAARQGP